MKTKEKIAIMQAYEDGKTIQYKEKDSSKWCEWLHRNKEPNWNWDLYDYRIKPESKLRPYTYEELVEEIKKHKNGYLIWGTRIVSLGGFTKKTIGLVGERGMSTLPYDNLIYLKWLDDGTPCGILEE